MRSLLRLVFLSLLPLSGAGAQARLDFVAITGGDNLGCGLTAGGEAWCWGNNDAGQMGSPSPECPGLQCADPPRRVASDVRFTRIDAGHDHVCALDSGGAAYCWGNNITGALGTEAALESCEKNEFLPPPDLLLGCSQRPLPVDGGLTFTAITAASTFSCGLTVTGEIHCWGLSGSGADRVIRKTPRKLAGDGPFRSVSADAYHVCAVDAGGRVHCWNRWASEPATTVPAPEPFTSVSVGWDHRCALTAAGTAYCWGNNHAGQVGTGRTPRGHERIAEPTPVAGLRRYREIFAGFTRTCAITAADALYCWGNGAGEAGTSSCFSVDAFFACSPSPIRVTEERFRAVGLGVIHGCAVTTEGAGYCWGRDYHGGFGDGRSGVIADTPVRVDWRG